MTMADVDYFKRSLRLTDTGDEDQDAATETLLQGCLDAAESFIQGAIGSDDGTFYQDNADIYLMAVYSLATAYYQNPSALGNGVAPIDLVMNALIGQLRGRYAVTKEGTDDGNNQQPG